MQSIPSDELFSNDLEHLPTLVSLPNITTFEFLVGSWKRLRATKSALTKKVGPRCFMTSLNNQPIG